MAPKSYRKMLEARRDFNPLIRLAQEGLTIEQLVEMIPERLGPYLSDRAVLQSMSPSYLAPDLLAVMRIEKDARLKALLPLVLGCYRKAFARNKEMSIDALLRHDSSVMKAINEYVSQGILEIDKIGLSLDELRYEAFRNIGALCEASILPLLRDLLHQVRIDQGDPAPDSDIMTIDFGMVVAELTRKADLADLLAPPPWGLRLNQWRNIAQHHDTRIDDEKIVAFYRAGRLDREISLGRGTVLELVYLIQGIYVVLKTSRALFLIDNSGKINSDVEPPVQKTESVVFHLASSLSTQGFELTDLVLDDDSVRAEVTDRTEQKSRGRIAHSMQFVQPVWVMFPKAKVEVLYRNRNGKPLMIIEADGKDCEMVHSDEDLGDLIQKVKLTPLG